MQFIRTNLVPAVYTLRESFVAIIPYVLLLVSCTLLLQILKFSDLHLPDPIHSQLTNYLLLLQSLFPIMLLISISYHFARLNRLSQIICALASLISYLTLGVIFAAVRDKPFDVLHIPEALGLVTPIINVVVLRYTLKLANIRRYFNISTEVAETFNYILPFILSCLLTCISILILEAIIIEPLLWIGSHLPETPGLIATALRAELSHLFWFLGLHGDNTHDLLFSNAFLDQELQKNLTYKEFYDLFIIYGGSGACLSLIFAILLIAEDRHSRQIATLGLPFAIFNISEIIIYGLPIMLNRHLLIPFLTLPLVNIFISGLMLSYDLIEFSNHNISWATPVFMNAWIATDGNPLALLLQGSLLLLGIFIYMPFVRRLSDIQNTPKSLLRLYERLNISSELENAERFIQSHKPLSYIEHHKYLYDSINTLQNNDLLLMYQPIIDTNNNHCRKLEALLRLRTNTDKLLPPFFLAAIERAGMAPIIDFWVCQQVCRDTEHQQNTALHVSINLHPDTLKDNEVIKKIIKIMQGMNVSFEIIERSFSGSNRVKANIRKLREAGFLISMDDFGTGYSGIAALSASQVDIVKIDKILLDQANSPEGLIILQHSCQMCLRLGLDLVIEGVETDQQLAIALSVGAQQVQGWYYSEALSWQDAMIYARRF